MWGAKGLSYDWYETFMALASKTMDLRLLKKLALNSIKYTTLETNHKEKCLEMFNEKWDIFMNNQSPVIQTLK